MSDITMSREHLAITIGVAIERFATEVGEDMSTPGVATVARDNAKAAALSYALGLDELIDLARS